MLNLAQLYEGWRNKLIPPADMKEQIEQVAKERLAICDRCSHQSENRKKTGRYHSIRPDVHCTECGCTLSAKTRCLACKCPINKWKEIMSEEQYDEIREELNIDNGEESASN